MKNLAYLALDLLCAITFPPTNGSDPEETADLERCAWQTIIHDLDPEEKRSILDAAQSFIDDMEARPVSLMSEDQLMKLEALKGLVDGSL